MKKNRLLTLFTAGALALSVLVMPNVKAAEEFTEIDGEFTQIGEVISENGAGEETALDTFDGSFEFVSEEETLGASDIGAIEVEDPEEYGYPSTDLSFINGKTLEQGATYKYNYICYRNGYSSFYFNMIICNEAGKTVAALSKTNYYVNSLYSAGVKGPMTLDLSQLKFPNGTYTLRAVYFKGSTLNSEVITYNQAVFYLKKQVEDQYPSSSSKLKMYRVYNPGNGEHFYTSNRSEVISLIGPGWRYEGIAWVAPKSSKMPVYRLYNKNAGDHHYTTSASEKNMLVSVGWKDEGIGWYSANENGKPLYRLYNKNATAGSHHYTTAASERDSLVAAGWKYEGIGWYGLK